MITKTDDDNLADMIWWLKGYLASHKLNDITSSDLCQDHIESLIKYKMAHVDEISKLERTK